MFADVFGLRRSLHRRFREAKVFYGSYSALVLLAAAIVLIPRAPLGLITTAVQALAGILLPSVTVFLVLLCNDRELLAPWVNKLWLNIVATIIVMIPADVVDDPGRLDGAAVTERRVADGHSQRRPSPDPGSRGGLALGCWS